MYNFLYWDDTSSDIKKGEIEPVMTKQKETEEERIERKRREFEEDDGA